MRTGTTGQGGREGEIHGSFIARHTEERGLIPGSSLDICGVGARYHQKKYECGKLCADGDDAGCEAAADPITTAL